MRKFQQLSKWLVCLPLSLLVILAWTATDEPVAQLRLDYAAFNAAEDDYRAQREFNALEGSEAAEYAEYVARLQRRVFEDCQRVFESGAPYPADLPCLAIVPSETQSADIAPQEEQTPTEQIAALDDMLNAGLGEYDERLLEEQKRIKAATPNNNSDGGGGGSGSGEDAEGDGTGDEGTEGNGAEGETGRNSGGTAGETGEAGDSGGTESGGSRGGSSGPGVPGNESDSPEDIPDGSDDDVVARQLREAAEKETDPELKAKLWEEYRRYKRGTD